jgi:hypothetical protein
MRSGKLCSGVKFSFEFAYVEQAVRQIQLSYRPGCWEAFGPICWSGLGLKSKGFHLGRFLPKPKHFETHKTEATMVTGPVSDPVAGLDSMKCSQHPRLPLGVLIGLR